MNTRTYDCMKRDDMNWNGIARLRDEARLFGNSTGPELNFGSELGPCTTYRSLYFSTLVGMTSLGRIRETEQDKDGTEAPSLCLCCRHVCCLYAFIYPATSVYLSPPARTVGRFHVVRSLLVISHTLSWNIMGLKRRRSIFQNKYMIDGLEE